MMTALPAVLNLEKKLGRIAEYWNPSILTHYNGNEVRLVKVFGEFIWHLHAYTDELFLVLDGTLEIEFRQGLVRLALGEMVIVPAGVEHRPRAENECAVLVMDRDGEPTTGSLPPHPTSGA